MGDEHEQESAGQNRNNAADEAYKFAATIDVALHTGVYATMSAHRFIRLKWIALLLGGALTLFAVYSWPRVAVWAALLDHDLGARSMMSEGWLAESRGIEVPIEHIATGRADSNCFPNEIVEWNGFEIGFDPNVLVIGAAPSETALRFETLEDRIDITIWESGAEILLQPVTDHPRLAKQYNALFERVDRLDVLQKVYAAGERSPFFTTPAAHFKREWLARLKASMLRVGTEDGIWLAHHDEFSAIIPRGNPRAIGVDVYVPVADRFFEMIVRGVTDSKEVNELLRCFSVGVEHAGD